MKQFTKKRSTIYRCFTEDREGPPHLFVNFRNMVYKIKRNSILDLIPTAPFVLFDSNCPLFYYWYSNETNCNVMKTLGYVDDDMVCGSISIKHVPTLIRNFFKNNIAYRQATLQRIDQILNPYQSALIPDSSFKSFAVPFRKYQNLICVHARFGKGASDFTDYRSFIGKDKVSVFADCIRSHDARNSYIYLATDSFSAKEELYDEFGRRLIVAAERAQHSAVELSKTNWTRSGVLTSIADFTISTMCSQFIGTSRSSFSALIEMLGNYPTIHVSKYNDVCTTEGLYLPQ